MIQGLSVMVRTWYSRLQLLYLHLRQKESLSYCIRKVNICKIPPADFCFYFISVRGSIMAFPKKGILEPKLPVPQNDLIWIIYIYIYVFFFFFATPDQGSKPSIRQ